MGVCMASQDIRSGEIDLHKNKKLSHESEIVNNATQTSFNTTICHVCDKMYLIHLNGITYKVPHIHDDVYGSTIIRRRNKKNI